jgi:hypothetical protein
MMMMTVFSVPCTDKVHKIAPMRAMICSAATTRTSAYKPHIFFTAERLAIGSRAWRSITG